jgi:hypothetical protein
VSVSIYLEGGGDSKELRVRCREGFRKLLESCGYEGRMPGLIACGARNAAYDYFKTAHGQSRAGDFIAMLVDSEDPVENIEAPWKHLKQRDGWPKPAGCRDGQVLLMTTCMETWIVCDRAALAAHYGASLQNSALPALVLLEGKRRGAVQDALVRATRNCSSAYAKGKRSFGILAKLSPAILERYLPSFARCRRILDGELHSNPQAAQYPAKLRSTVRRRR